MIKSSIGYGNKSISELEPILGLCCCYNSATELQQEAPDIFCCIFLADSDYGVTRSKKNLRGGSPSKIFVAHFSWLNILIEKNISEGTPLKITVAIFTWIA